MEERPVRETVVTEGEPVSSLSIPISGTAEVQKSVERIGEVKPGHIIGTALALTGDPSPVRVTFTEPTRYMRWSLSSIRQFVDMRPDLRAALQRLVNRDLAQKLNRVINHQSAAQERT
ncbi:MAG TPA: cyclic nucleotide-binding domain-containing protein [Candidatus Binatia bacterium]